MKILKHKYKNTHVKKPVKTIKLTQKELKRQLHYNPDTGVFTRKISVCVNAIKGDVAGCNNGQGYLVITVNCKRYLVHRLAWFYMYGYFPENDIDHKNRIRNDNRITNLRLVSKSCNLRNTGNHKNNTSGVKGISWDKSKNKWKAYICTNKLYTLGYFNDFNDAVCIRLMAEQCLSWSNCDSHSPAFKYVQENIIKPYKENL